LAQGIKVAQETQLIIGLLLVDRRNSSIVKRAAKQKKQTPVLRF